MPPLDTENRFAVTCDGKGVAILGAIPWTMTSDEALNLAAHLVATARVDKPRFIQLLAEIERGT